jgi:hypothetical protein
MNSSDELDVSQGWREDYKDAEFILDEKRIYRSRSRENV